MLNFLVNENIIYDYSIGPNLTEVAIQLQQDDEFYYIPKLTLSVCHQCLIINI